MCPQRKNATRCRREEEVWLKPCYSTPSTTHLTALLSGREPKGRIGTHESVSMWQPSERSWPPLVGMTPCTSYKQDHGRRRLQPATSLLSEDHVINYNRQLTIKLDILYAVNTVPTSRRNVIRLFKDTYRTAQ